MLVPADSRADDDPRLPRFVIDAAIGGSGAGARRGTFSVQVWV